VPAAIPAIEPDSFRVGDTVPWTRTLTDYPASAWTLTYAFAGPSTFTVVATASGDDFAVTITSAVSSAYRPGRYAWQSYASAGAARYLVASGSCEILPDLSLYTTPHDSRSWARRVLEALQATIEGRASRDQTSIMVDGLQIGRMTPTDLLKMWGKFNALVDAEDNAAALAKGLGSKRNLFVRFVAP
jgi:hypothetical protein